MSNNFYDKNIRSDIEVIPADKIIPEMSYLPWTVVEYPAQAWICRNGKMFRCDEHGKLVNTDGFLVDQTGEMLKDSDGNFILSKDQIK